MFNLEFKDSKSIIIIEEDSIPALCGLVKGDDLSLAISIKIYKNNKGKKGKLNNSYSRTWFTTCTNSILKKFVIKFLSDVAYRDKYKLSSIGWSDDYIVSEEEVSYIDKTLKENKGLICNIAKNEVDEVDESTQVSPGPTYSSSTLKKEAINLLISDEEIDGLSKVFSDKDELLFAICEVAKGKSVEETIKYMTKQLVIA